MESWENFLGRALVCLEMESAFERKQMIKRFKPGDFVYKMDRAKNPGVVMEEFSNNTAVGLTIYSYRVRWLYAFLWQETVSLDIFNEE